MAKRRGKAHMAWVRSHRKRAGRRNAFPVAGLVANPKRRRKTGGRSRRSYAVVMGNRRRRHHYRRNPAIMGINIPSFQPILYASAGYAGSVILEDILTGTKVNADGTTTTPIIPTSITGSSLGKYAVRVGCVIAVSYLAKMALGAEKAKMVGTGGGVYVLISAVKEFAPAGTLPGLNAYTPLRGLNAYAPGLRRNGTMFGVNRQVRSIGPGNFAEQLAGGRDSR